MSIIRSARKEQNFSILSNKVLQDPRLSMRALGLLVRLLSRPDNWETNSEILAREFDCGREQMRAVLGELRDHGYMKLVKSQNEKGYWSSQWFVLEEPETQEQQQTLPNIGQPEPGNRVLGQPDAIQSTDYKELKDINSHQQTTDCPHQTLIDLFTQKVAELPKPRVWTSKRQKDMAARWKQVMSEKNKDGSLKHKTREDGIAFFARFFDYVAESDFLTGRNGMWDKCDLPWLMKEENFAKTIEGQYENRSKA